MNETPVLTFGPCPGAFSHWSQSTATEEKPSA